MRINRKYNAESFQSHIVLRDNKRKSDLCKIKYGFLNSNFSKMMGVEAGRDCRYVIMSSQERVIIVDLQTKLIKTIMEFKFGKYELIKLGRDYTLYSSIYANDFDRLQKI